MAIYKHTDGNLLLNSSGHLTNSNTCCCDDVGYCCINGDCVDLDDTIGLTCAACTENGGVCHRSTTVTCATQSLCSCSEGSGVAGTGGSYCTGTGMGVTLV